ncbi:carboxyl-terminal-processing peptidase 1, chloroplastic [Dorcoceras hygrometricum]|uniref:Carboxyl-terminal-processing peptidase 1, chloroplastic n=1 Tax=Dorcoceras hygrometricum TaxID=472368 RepID=A0A2Z7D5B7_9LAMI|nr:carboxyl-terminal-processing peptidase 1, chloroplastic [Dorcoceras hygrometricum]
MLARTETPRHGDRKKSDHEATDGGGRRWRVETGGGGVRFWRRGGRTLGARVRLIQLAVGPQSLRLRNHNFGLAHRIMVKSLATSPHDPLGITDSACKNQLVVVSVQYGPFNTYIPIRSTTIGKSRVARDPIAMHTSWRSNSDIASVTSIGYPRMRASGESSTTKLRLLHASGPHPIPPPNDPKDLYTIIPSDCIGYPRMRASGESSTMKLRLLHASGPHPIPPPNDPK